MFFLILFSVLLLCSIAGAVYIVRLTHRFRPVEKLAQTHKKLSWLAACAPVFLILIVMLWNIFTGIIFAIHLIVFWFLCHMAGLLIKKIKKTPLNYNLVGFFGIFLTIAYLSAGWYFAHHIYETSYHFETTKELPAASVRLVLIADSHLGVTMDGEDFSAEIERIRQTQPDIVVVAGDFVDDASHKSDMIQACKALGSLKTTYGVYFVFGNHDEGYSKESRDFSEDDLRKELLANHVTILEDESLLIADSFYLIGRKDKSAKIRAGIDELTAPLDNSKYMIVLDHQPNDYEKEATAGVDLVLSGHTHGGHIFPAGPLGILIGSNDAYYGLSHRENTDFIVTSGISGWEIPLKTGAISEYVVIDISTKAP